MAGKKELYLHIGTAKTGTTTLQQFFFSNRDALRKKGIIYPSNPGDFYTHHRLSWSLRAKGKQRQWNWSNDLGEPEEEWKFVLKQLTGGKGLISSENLFGLTPETISEVRKFTSEFHTKLIVYWRRRDASEDSSYNQRVKGGGNKAPPSYRANTISRKKLDQWAGAFGKKNVILRPYERRQLYQGDIVADFFHHILGLELTDEFTLPEEERNVSLHRVVLEYKRQVNHLPIAPLVLNRKLTIPLQGASDMLSGKGRKSYPVFPPQQRLQLVKECAKENAAIAREYLGRKDGKLFYDPLPDLNEDWQPYNELLEEDAQTINGYLAEDYPDEFEIIVRGIFQAQYSNDSETRQAALKLLPGISPSHIRAALAHNLKAGASEDMLFIPQSRLEQIYSSRTWKVGTVLKRVYKRLPSGLQKILLAAARAVSRKIRFQNKLYC